jgi:hypothetical protein
MSQGLRRHRRGWSGIDVLDPLNARQNGRREEGGVGSGSAPNSAVSAVAVFNAGPHVGQWRACCHAASTCAGG